MSATEPVTYPGRCSLSMVNSLDTYGYLTTVEWDADQVTITRTASGHRDAAVTAERDTVTENALLNLIVPGARPAPAFRVIILGDDTSGNWSTFVTLRVEGGQVTIKRGPQGDDESAALPAWFLNVLHDFVFGEFAAADREDAAAA